MSGFSFDIFKKNVMQPCLENITNNIPNITLNYTGGSEHPYNRIEVTYDELRSSAERLIKSERLDRHKLAACMCGAVVAGKPLIYKLGYEGKKNINEIFAAHMGLRVLKSFLIYDVFNGRNNLSSSEIAYKKCIEDKFDMEFLPLEENICDKTTYEINFVNALNRIEKCCKNEDIPCYKFDVWAYSKLFYHLDVHNKNRFIKFKFQYKHSSSSPCR